jgi:hypothetical protein
LTRVLSSYAAPTPYYNPPSGYRPQGRDETGAFQRGRGGKKGGNRPQSENQQHQRVQKDADVRALYEYFGDEVRSTFPFDGQLVAWKVETIEMPVTFFVDTPFSQFGKCRPSQAFERAGRFKPDKLAAWQESVSEFLSGVTAYIMSLELFPFTIRSGGHAMTMRSFDPYLRLIISSLLEQKKSVPAQLLQALHIAESPFGFIPLYSLKQVDCTFAKVAKIESEGGRYFLADTVTRYELDKVCNFGGPKRKVADLAAVHSGLNLDFDFEGGGDDGEDDEEDKMDEASNQTHTSRQDQTRQQESNTRRESDFRPTGATEEGLPVLTGAAPSVAGSQRSTNRKKSNKQGASGGAYGRN